MSVLLGNDWHERSAQGIYDRYRYRDRHPVSVWAHPAAQGHVTCVITDTVAEGAVLPGAVRAYELGVPYPSEVAYYLPPHRALTFGDSIIGAGDGRLRVAPAWWAAKDPTVQTRYRTAFRHSRRRLLDLPLDLVLPAHGPSVLADAHAALAAGLDAPAWGED